MPILVERTLFRIGQSLAVTLPKDWVNANNLKAGDKVEVTADKEVIIRSRKKKVYT